jgi:hypothetical protein
LKIITDFGASTMEIKTLQALIGSIKKWDRIRKLEDVDKGTSNCPLCQMYFLNANGPNCAGCPVAEVAKDVCCYNTPYKKFRGRWEVWEIYDAVNVFDGKPEFKYAKHKEEYIRLATKEYEFLLSLLPAGEIGE